MAEVVLENVTKVYPGGVRAVDRVSFTVADREFVVLVGPSGCGKTTTLRMVAGLEEVTAGTIRIGGRVVNQVAPQDRDVAMVFQNYALYPHMTVRKNMAFGLLMRRKCAGWTSWPARLASADRRRAARQERASIEGRVREAAALLEIEELLDRRPKALSGGERQRVAVGRAIVREPKVFLFDEPLSNLDAKLRTEMRAELKRLHRRVRTTTIYVTHDQEEAMTLGDRVAVLKDGVVQQCAAPLEVYERPVNRFVAGFVGTPAMNFLPGRLVRAGRRLYFEDGESRVAVGTAAGGRAPAGPAGPVIMGVRPEALCPVSGAKPGTALRVRVSVVEPLGDRMDVLASTERHRRIVCRTDARTRVKEGELVDMQIDLNRVHFFESDGEGRNLSLGGAPE